MKTIVVVLALLIVSLSVYAQVTVTPPEVETPGNTAQINALIQEVRELKANLPQKSDMDSSFAQLDQKITDTSSGSSFNTLGYFIFGMLLNDIFLVSFFIIGRGKGWI